MSMIHTFVPSAGTPAAGMSLYGAARAPAIDPLARRFDAALQLLEAGDAWQAYAELARLAEHGHPPAARVALMLSRRGPSLFGGNFPATLEARERWLQLAG
jgi:hypothetical protein